MNTSAQAHGRGLRSPAASILGLVGALGAFGGVNGAKVTAIGPDGKSRDINSPDELDALLREAEAAGGVAALDIEGTPGEPFKVERDGQEFPVPNNHPLAGILAGQSPFNGIPSAPSPLDGLIEHKTASRRDPAAALAGLAALSALFGGGPSAPGGPDYRIPRSRGPRRLPWEPRAGSCGNPNCPIHGNKRVPSTPDDRAAVLTLSGAIEVEADYSEDPAAKDWIAWVRANYNVGYVRCGKCGAVTRVRYWNEFDLHDCVRKLPCLRCGALHTQVTVDGDPDNE